MGSITYKSGICSGCLQERLIVHKSKCLCAYCNQKKGKTTPKQFKARKPLKKKLKKATGEAELFKEIWNDLEVEERVSFVTGFSLPDQHEMRTYYFSHVLSKGSRPELRLVKENIVLMTLREHQQWEFEKHKIKNDPQWKKVFDLAEKLKTYAQINNLREKK